MNAKALYFAKIHLFTAKETIPKLLFSLSLSTIRCVFFFARSCFSCLLIKSVYHLKRNNNGRKKHRANITPWPSTLFALITTGIVHSLSAHYPHFPVRVFIVTPADTRSQQTSRDTDTHPHTQTHPQNLSKWLFFMLSVYLFSVSNFYKSVHKSFMRQTSKKDKRTKKTISYRRGLTHKKRPLNMPFSLSVLVHNLSELFYFFFLTERLFFVVLIPSSNCF